MAAIGAAAVDGAVASLALTEEQEQSVARRAEPLLLSAAAGSGKTSVLVERLVRAVREDGVAPARMLAITFTERAAGELQERARTRLLELGEREAARDMEAAFVGTFHGFCARLLRAHPLLAGLDPEFAILEESLAARLRERAFTSALRDFLEGERDAVVDLLAAYGVDRVHSMVEGVHAELRSRGQRFPRLPMPTVDPQADAADVDAAAACALLDELLAGFGRSYEELKRGRGAVDFDDLELCAGELLAEHESVRAAWSERFELLMVDEFQDTNPRQLGILRALDRGNLFTVGDEFQSIYAFRHADVRLFRARRDELAGRGGSLALTRNFRSRAPLLDVVNAVFEERFTGFTPLVSARQDTERSDDPDAGGPDSEGPDSEGPDSGEPLVQAQPVDGGELGRGPLVEGEPLVELLLTDRSGWEQDEELAGEIARGLPAATLWRQAEARLLAERVTEMVQSGQAGAGDVVLLLRALGDLPVYERALQLRGLRTLATVGGFWEHQQIGDLLAYLRALANPLDEQALYATLASPLVGLSRDGLALLARAARAGGRGVWETALRAHEQESIAGLDGRERDELGMFCARLQSERSTASQRTISELIERAIDAYGYREHVLGLAWGERRLANIHKLLRLARRFEAGEGRDLRAFLDHVAHLKDAKGSAEPDAPVERSEPDAVRLMSIHAAKGLEFPVVCVADLGRALNTRVADLLVDGDRVGLQLVRPDGEKPAPSLDFEQLSAERRRAEAEEEDRILYVAMTRARERLVLSGAVDFERWPEQRQAPSTISWLGPALAAELPALVQEAQRRTLDLAVGASGEARVRCRLSAPGAGAFPGSGARGEGFSQLGGASHVQGAPHLAAPSVGSRPRGPESLRTTAGALAVLEAGTLSYTSLSELERCGYRYYLERILGLAENRGAARGPSGGGGLQARARGRLVHRLLESVDFARPRAPSPEHVATLARELGMRLSEEEREEIGQLVGAATTGAGAVAGGSAAAGSAASGSAAARSTAAGSIGTGSTAARSSSALLARVAAAESVHREYPFAFSLGAQQPLLVGVIDLLAREATGGFLVLDYKSDRVGAQDDLDALIEREYGVQRLLYALAVLRAGAAKVEVVHWFLERPDEWVAARFTAADREELQERLAGRIERARGRAFAVSENPHRGLCETCPGRGGLCSYSDAETLRDAPWRERAVG
jgi:ATP-dependent helicase/nuclease subunit A